VVVIAHCQCDLENSSFVFLKNKKTSPMDPRDVSCALYLCPESQRSFVGGRPGRDSGKLVT
jgi:hypothetical protein